MVETMNKDSDNDSLVVLFKWSLYSMLI